MARGINKVILIGHVGNDPEVRYMPSGGAVTSLTVATNEAWKDKQSGEAQERTEWHRIVFFNRLAEIAGEYLKKGSKVYIEGSLRTRKWQDKNGVDRYTTEIVAGEMQILDSKPGAGGMDNFDQRSATRPEFSGQTQGQSAPKASSFQSEPQFDDDIPF